MEATPIKSGLAGFNPFYISFFPSMLGISAGEALANDPVILARTTKAGEDLKAEAEAVVEKTGSFIKSGFVNIALWSVTGILAFMVVSRAIQKYV